MLSRLLLLGCLFLVTIPAQARQDDDAPLTLPIAYGEAVSDTLTAQAFYDWWQVEAAAGDVIVVAMQAADGLEPLLGILDASGTLQARSDDGAPDGYIELEYQVAETGLHTIVATRVGNAAGTSTGSYDLRLALANPPTVMPDLYDEVVFRCGAYEATAAVSLRFGRALSSSPGQLIAYGLGGFAPVLRLEKSDDPESRQCLSADDAAGDTLTLPGAAAQTFAANEARKVSAVLDAETWTVTLGSEGKAAGHYALVITGFTLENANDEVIVEITAGPLAAEGGLGYIYMLDAERAGRLDPAIRFDDTAQGCDDAGRRGCEGVPSAAGVGLTLPDGLSLAGDRFDAGLALRSGRDSQRLVLGSFSGNTGGDFALLLTGSLPE